MENTINRLSKDVLFCYFQKYINSIHSCLFPVTILIYASILSYLSLRRLPIASTPNSLQSILHLQAIKIFGIINYSLKSLFFALRIMYQYYSKSHKFMSDPVLV